MKKFWAGVLAGWIVPPIILAGIEFFFTNDPESKSALIEKAIRQKDYDEVKKIITEGEDINKERIYTPLLIAVGQKNTKMIILLLENGAHINQLCGDFIDRTVLDLAYDKEICHFLRQRGALHWYEL